MATWVRQATFPAVGTGSNLAGVPSTLNNAIPPADFDPAGVTAVQLQFSIIASGFNDDDWDTSGLGTPVLYQQNTTNVMAGGGPNGWGTLFGVFGDNNGNTAGDPYSSTDSTIATTWTTTDWVNAQLRLTSGTTWATYDQNMANDQGQLSMSTMTVTITYTPSSAKSGSGAISNGHTVTATGFKGGLGAGAISHGHTVTANPFPTVVYSESWRLYDSDTITDSDSAVAAAAENTGLTDIETGQGDIYYWLRDAYARFEATDASFSTGPSNGLQYRLNGGSWVTVNAASAIVKRAANSVDNAVTDSQRLTAVPHRTWAAGASYSDTNQVSATSLNAVAQSREFAYHFVIDTNALSGSDELEFRFGTLTNTDRIRNKYTATTLPYPKITFVTPTVGGSGAISHGHTVTATGEKGGEGAAPTISHGHTVIASGFKGGEGAGSISHGHSVTAVGNAAENKSGSGAISHGHTVTATGTAAEDRSGSGSISHGHTTAATGTKAEDRSGSGSISHGHTVTATGQGPNLDKSGSGAISHGHTTNTARHLMVAMVGYRWFDGAASNTDAETATALAAKDTPLSVQAQSGIVRAWLFVQFVGYGNPYASGEAAPERDMGIQTGYIGTGTPEFRVNAGAWTDIQANTTPIGVADTTVTDRELAAPRLGTLTGKSEGVIGVDSPAFNIWRGQDWTDVRYVYIDPLEKTEIAILVEIDTDSLAADDVVQIRWPDFENYWDSIWTNRVVEDRYGLLDAGLLDVTPAAFSGSGSISHGHTVSATGVKGGQGSVGVSHGHTTDATGTKGGQGTAAISHPHTVTATGDLLEVRSGAGSISHGHTVAATGFKGASGSGSISHGHTVTANGIGPDPNARNGSAAFSNGHTVTASGQKLEVRSGAASISHGHSVVASGNNPDQPTGSGVINHGHTVVVAGFKGGIGIAAVGVGPTTVSAVGFKGGVTNAIISVGHSITASGIAAEYEGSALNAYVNGQWVTGRLKRYSGTGWAGALVRRWNGSSWEDMP